jgi:hypothetical protein
MGTGFIIQEQKPDGMHERELSEEEIEEWAVKLNDQRAKKWILARDLESANNLQQIKNAISKYVELNVTL